MDLARQRREVRVGTAGFRLPKGALQQALQAEHPVPGRRPTLPGWIRDLVVAHASEVLRVEVTRAALRPAPGGAPNWKRWRLAQAVRRAAPRRRRARR